MTSAPLPSSADLAKYLETRGELGKPWMWHLLRLIKIKEERDGQTSEQYVANLADAHADLMRLGEFWKGREGEVFGGQYSPQAAIEPLPGTDEDR